MIKQKTKLFFILFFLVSGFLGLPAVSLARAGWFLVTPGYAEEPELKKAKKLEAVILSNPSDKQNTALLDELSEIYLSQHQYAQLMDALRKLEKVKASACDLPVSYYIGLCRYHQLKHLEDNQDWKEYFDIGNAYRQELFLETQNLAELCPASAFGVRAQLLNWLQHKAQNDAQAESSLNKLIDMVNSFANSGAPEIAVIKEVADSLSKGEEPAFARSAYNLYVNRLLAMEKSAFKLQSSAESILKEGNVNLAEIIYDRYVELSRATLSKDNLATELIAIARQFASDGWAKGKDLQYAEKIFGILQEACGKGYFTEELQYLRAYNLQRLKDYHRSAQEYAALVTDFPQGQELDETEFKLGIIYTYILGQKEEGRAYWQKVIERNSRLEYTVESLYHKSLVSQYSGDLETAKAGYARILELIRGNPDFKDIFGRVSSREKEIQEPKPMEYNLKAFLDTTLKQPLVNQSVGLPRPSLESIATYEGRGLELLVNPPKVISSKEEEVKFSGQQLQIETGCFAPELTYLWSGDLGNLRPIPTGPEFTTFYQTPGTKVVNLVVLSPAGVIGSALDMVEVYNKK